MVDKCEICQNPAEFSCICDTFYRFCGTHYYSHAENGNHNPINLEKRKQEIRKVYQPVISILNNLKKELISRSNQLIQLVKIISTNKVFTIQKFIDNCESLIKSNDISPNIENMLKAEENIRIVEYEMQVFIEAINKSLRIYKNSDEIIEKNADLEKFLNEIKLKTIKFSEDPLELRKQLESEFTLLSEGHQNDVNALAITKDNNYLISGSSDCTVRVWNLKENLQEAVLKGHKNTVKCVAVTDDNKLIISSALDRKILVWSLFEKKLKYSFEVQSFAVNTLAISNDNQFLLTGSDQCLIKKLSLSNRSEIGSFNGHTSHVNSVVVSFDNKFVVSGSLDSTVRIWDFVTMKQLGVLQGHSGSVLAVVVTNDNQYIISGSEDGNLRVWKFLKQRIQDSSIEQTLYGHCGPIRSVAVTSDNKFLVSGSDDLTLRKWNLLTWQIETQSKIHEKAIRSVLITKDNKFAISASSDRTLKVTNLSDDTSKTLPGHTENVSYIAVKGKYTVTGSDDRSLRVWDILLRKQVGCLVFDKKILSFYFENEVIIIEFVNQTTERWNFLDLFNDF